MLKVSYCDHQCPSSTISLNDISLTLRPIFTKLYRNISLMGVYQNCSNGTAPLNKMATRAKYRKYLKDIAYASGPISKLFHWNATLMPLYLKSYECLLTITSKRKESWNFITNHGNPKSGLETLICPDKYTAHIIRWIVTMCWLSCSVIPMFSFQLKFQYWPCDIQFIISKHSSDFKCQYSPCDTLVVNIHLNI